MPQRLVYSEEHPGLRWPAVAIFIAGWSLLIGCGIAMHQLIQFTWDPS